MKAARFFRFLILFFSMPAMFLFAQQTGGTIDELSAAIAQNPENASLYFERAMAYKKFGDTVKALDDYKTVIKLDSGIPAPYYNIGNIYLTGGKFNDAIQYYKTAVKLNPKFAYAYNNMGNASVKLGLTNDGMQYYNKAIGADKNFALPYFNRGLIYFGWKKYDPALADFYHATDLYPNYTNAFTYIIKTYVEMFKLETVEESMKTNAVSESTDIAPGNISQITNNGTTEPVTVAPAGKTNAASIPFEAKEYVKIGKVLMTAEQYRLAIDHYTRAIQIAPDYLEAYQERAKAYSAMEENSLALDDYKKVLDLIEKEKTLAVTEAPLPATNLTVPVKVTNAAVKPTNSAVQVVNGAETAQVHYDMATIYVKQKKESEAIGEYSAALDLNPDMADAYFMRGVLLEQKCDFTNAIKD